MAGNEFSKISVYRKKQHFNIGIIIFGVIFLYLLVTVLLYLTKNHISAYEVREGSILKDRAYTGFIVRDETVVNAEKDGYVNYFSTEAGKVGAKTKVYTISDKKLNFKDTDETEVKELSADEKASMMVKLQSFSDNYKEEQFADVYALKNNITAMLESKSSQNRQSQLDEMLAANGDALQVFYANSDGIILYSIDGYEDTDLSKITEKMIFKDGYENKKLKNNTKVKAGDPVYKLIKDDNWTLVIPLDDATAKDLAKTERVKVRFSKDNETARASFKIQKTKEGSLGLLTFHTSMIRYAGERYLDIELILEDESGLKIPKSSVVKKAFYTVPEDFLTQGGNSKETGVLIQHKRDQAIFQKVDVYNRDTEKGLVYLDPNVFEKNSVLIKPDSNETFALQKTKSLKGVYNINKGYAVFKQIQILCESDEYYIVRSGNSYGLSNYDHIALDGKYVRENDVVY